MKEDETEPSRMLTVTDVAQWLSVSSSLVYQLVESGKLPVYRIGNGRGAIRFQTHDINQYIESCRSESSQPPSSRRKLRPNLRHIQLD